MYTIDQAAGQVVATDTQTTVDAFDKAVMSLAHLCASIVEVSKASNLPISTVQPALANAAGGLARLVDSRQDMSRAVHDLIDIQKGSTLKTVSFGCPDGFPGSATLEPGIEVKAADRAQAPAL